MVSANNEYVLQCNCNVCSGQYNQEIIETVLPIILNEEGMGHFNPKDWMIRNSPADYILGIFRLFPFFSKLNNIHALFKIKQLQIQQQLEKL